MNVMCVFTNSRFVIGRMEVIVTHDNFARSVWEIRKPF